MARAKVDDERAPLLAEVAPAPLAEPVPDPPHVPDDAGVIADDDTPLPVAQILLLCYTRLVEPIAFFSIFPYINKMIEEVGGVEKEEVGFYSGLIESLFSATQMCVMIFWGKASDRFGRKPVLVFSLFGVTGATALFGFSRSIWQMVLFRCIAGVFAGTVVTVRAMLAENSTKNTQARAFSYFATAGNIGIFIGPFIGGALESPAEKFKSTFGRIHFFHQYPYVLPSLATAAVGLSATIVTALFVKETLHVHVENKKSDRSSMSTWDLLNYPGIRPVLIIYNYVMILAFAFTAVYPVFMYTPIELGGLSFSPPLIATFMGGGGLAQAMWLLIAFPFLHARMGNGGVLRLCTWIWPLFFLVDPLCNLLLRYNYRILFWIIYIFNNVFGCSVAMAFTCIQLAVNDIAPSHETFGTLNSIVLAVQSGTRAVFPALSTSLYAVGVKYHILSGQLFWIVLAAFAAGLWVVVGYLPAKAQGKLQRPEQEAA